MGNSPGAERPSPATLYLAEIKRKPRLSRQEEAEIARRAGATGDVAELNRLVEANLAFVAKVAAEYISMGLSFDDLLNEGNIGLMEAARRYDPGRGTKFITYAVWWIRKSIMDAIYSQAGLIRVPRNRMRKAGRLRETEDQLHAELGRPPDRKEISARLSCSPSEIDTTRMIKPVVTSLDAEAGDEGATLRGIIPDESAPDPEAEVLRSEGRALVRWSLQWLSEQERTILTQRAGMNGAAPLSLKEIAAGMGLSRERIRQIEAEAKRKLKRIVEHLLSPPPDAAMGEVRIPPRFARSAGWRERGRNGWRSASPDPSRA